jgi:glutamate-1-semialdehyde aminotransferase
MIELKLYVSEVDFEATIQALAGTGFAGNAAVLAARALPDSAKEELAVKYMNANAEKLQDMMQSAAERKGIRMKISGAQASIVDA